MAMLHSPDDNHVPVGSYTKPHILEAVGFVVIKNLRLKSRAFLSTVVEILLPSLFMIAVLPAYYAAGFSTWNNREFDGNFFDPDEYFKPWMCRLDGPTENYQKCNDTPASFHCLGNLCLTSDVPDNNDDGRLSDILSPWLYVENATKIPSYDLVALWRNFAMTVELPGEDTFSDDKMVNSIATGVNVSFVPNTPEQQGIVDGLHTFFMENTYTYQFTRQHFKTESDAMSFATSHDGSDRIWAVIVVNGPTDFVIRMNRTSTPGTDAYDSTKPGFVRKFRIYLGGGFLSIQNLINQNITGVDSLPSTLIPMPVQGYRISDFMTGGGFYAPLMLTLSFLFPMSQVVSQIVREKESRVREAMLIMGLSSSAFKLSWVVTTMLQMVVTGFILSIVMQATMLHEMEYSIVFLLFFSYGLSLASAGVLLSTLFSKASLAGIVSPMVFLFSALPSFILQDPSSTTSYSLSIFNTCAFSEAMSIVFKAAGRGAPVTWDTANDGRYSFLSALGFLWLDTVLYLVVALWLDQVMPSEWGAKKPFFYFCWPPYWFRSASFANLSAVDGMFDRRNMESITEQALLRKERIKITNLRKEFKGETKEPKVAVNNVNLSLYEGQILALLGHNGAGKTTLINMLTGMLPVTSGDATVYENSIVDNLGEVRRDIGLCPQHNILWDNMTCAEHLRYYGRVKGIPSGELEQQVDNLLEKVGLAGKKNVDSASLSGGMKRKLSVGIALIGGSKFIILDEPTAGMDVQARRAIWDLLKNMRTGRTVLLTTHFMDEADLLGDSIAILHGGRVHCWGSSFFLKQKLGVGYNLTMELDAGSSTEKIAAAVRKEVAPLKANNPQEVEQLSAAGSELTLRVPMWGVPNFAQMFAALEKNGKELGIMSFGMSVTTLEEIFIKIAHDLEHREPTDKTTKLLSDVQPTYDGKAELLKGIDIDPNERLHDSALYRSQWRGLFYKKLQYGRRDKCTIAFQLVLPVVFIMFTMMLAGMPVGDLPSIDLWRYGEDSIFPVAPADSTYATNTIEGVTPVPTNYSSIEAMDEWLLHRNDTENVKCWQALYQSTVGWNAHKTLFHNASSLHSLPIALNGFASAVLKEQTGNRDAYIKLVANPMPFSDFFKNQIEGMIAVMTSINVMLPFCFIPANYVAFLVKERVSKSKHVQIVSGVKLTAYWLSSFCWDLAAFAVSTSLSIIVFFMFDRTEYIGSGEAFAATVMLFLSYGMTAIVAAYAASFHFEKPSTGQNTVLMGNYVSGFVLVIVIGIFQIIDSTKGLAKDLRFVFRLVPAFCLGDGIMALAQLPSNRNNGMTDDTPLTMNIVGWDIVFLWIMFPIYAALAMSHDFPQIWYKLGLRTPPDTHDTSNFVEPTNMDDDVAAEKAEVMAGRAGDVVAVKKLRKVYPGKRPKVAVKEITFGVKTDEIFAFLGTNGAGKTTAISVLAGDFAPTSGTASIKGYDVVTQSTEAKRELGYCPQFDALLDLLTPKEHIELYAALRGVPSEMRKKMSESLMKILGLEEHQNTICKSLSGGNKRKTSIAISLIGGPSCILLDEPTAGMDPVARRGMWTALQSIGKGRCVVLTTHHLEEVEALAHRTAIMVDGALQCLGTLSHLKSKFGGAYEIQAKVAPQQEGAVVRFFTERFPSSVLIEQTNHRLTYQLPSGQKLSEMFSTINNARESLGIVDYSINETSLEQVFIAICKQYMHHEHEDSTTGTDTSVEQKKNPLAKGIQGLMRFCRKDDE